MNKIIIDIETKPTTLDKINRVMPEIKQDSRLKDPIKIAQDLEEKRQKFVNEAALSALTGELLMVGWMENPDSYGFNYDQPEQVLLEKLFNLISDHHVITFNGHKFDLPFIVRRGWLYGLDFHSILYGGGKYILHDKSTDLMQMWAAGTEERVSLKTMSSYFMVGDKTEPQLAYELFAKRGKIAETGLLTPEQTALTKRATEYLLNDLKLTYTCAKIMGQL